MASRKKRVGYLRQTSLQFLTLCFDSAWYDRLALVLMTHYGGDVDKKREAVLVCHEGLTDPDTHLSAYIAS